MRVENCPRSGAEVFNTEYRLEASAKDSSGQCALGAPLRKGEEIVRREKDGLNIILDSGEDGCRRIWPTHFILESEIRSEEGTQEGRTGYANESNNSLAQGESVGEMTLWK